jgi:hypothetical protein
MVALQTRNGDVELPSIEVIGLQLATKPVANLQGFSE